MGIECIAVTASVVVVSCDVTTLGRRPGSGLSDRCPVRGAAGSGEARRASPAAQPIFWVRSRRALPMTLTEDSAIAAAAIIGESSIPVTG